MELITNCQIKKERMGLPGKAHYFMEIILF